MHKRQVLFSSIVNRLASARQVTPPRVYTVRYLHDATLPAPVSAVLLLRLLLLVMSHNC